MSLNFGTSTVAVAPSPATSGTTLTVLAGTGSRLVAGQASVMQTGVVPTPATAEVVTISAVAGDVLTVVRAQEGSSARAIRVGDTIVAGVTAGMWDALAASAAATAAQAASTASTVTALAAALPTTYVGLDVPRLVEVPGRWGMERALYDRRTRPLVMVWIGASTTEGSVATNDLTTVMQVSKMLQAQVNPPGIRGGYGLKVRAWETTTGTTGETPDIDLMKHRTLAAGATVSHTTLQPFTGLRLHFLEGPAYGQFSIVLDGTTFTITPDTTKAADSPTGVWVSPVLARQVRTVTITAIGAASLGNSYFFDGDQNVGLQFFNGGRAGGQTSTFLNTASFWTRLAALQPDIVPMMIGFNDMGASVSQATYQANLQSLIANINAASPSKTVWIPLIAQQAFAANVALWAPYKVTLRAVSQLYPNTTFHDFGQVLPTTRLADPAFELIYTDDTHMTSKGHIVAAAQVVELMAVGTRNTLPVDPPATDDLTWNYSADSALLGEWDANTLAGANGSSVASLAPSFGSLGLALTQATGGKQPTIVTGPNSRKALHFVAASSQELATTAFTAQTTPATVMAVWRRTGSSGTRLWSGVSSTFLSCQITSGAPYNYRLDTGTAPSASTPWTGGPDAAWHIMIVVYNGANTLLYAQARTPVTMGLAAAQVNYNGFSLARNQTGSAFADVEISALTAFKRALTSFEVGRLFDIWSASCAISVAN